MKRIIFGMFCFVVLFWLIDAPAASAQSQTEKPYEVNGVCGLASEYLAQNGANFHDGTFLSCEATVLWKKPGLYLNVWTSTGLVKKNVGDKETDVEVGKLGKFTLKKIGRVNYSLAAARYFVKGIDALGFMADFSLPKKTKRVSWIPGIQVAGFIPVSTGGPKKGVFLHVYLKGKYQVSKDWIFLERTRATFGTSAFGFKSGNFIRQDFEIQRKINSHVAIGGGVGISLPIQPTGDSRKTEIVPKFAIYFK